MINEMTSGGIAMAITAHDTDATIDYVTKLQASNGGFSPSEGSTGATIPATLAAIRVLNYLGSTIPNLTQCQKFVLSCINPSNGGISYSPDDTSNTDVYSTSVGTLALAELGLASVEICNAILVYLDKNTSDNSVDEFLNAYFAAFAWEAIGIANPDMPMPNGMADKWISTINEKGNDDGTYGKSDENVAATAEAVAAKIRLGQVDPFEDYQDSATFLQNSQQPDSGYGESGTSGSVPNIAVTYEVMRAFNLLNTLPSTDRPNQVSPLDPKGVIKFVASCGNPDGGYGDPPTDPSSAANPTYFAIYTLKFLSAI